MNPETLKERINFSKRMVEHYEECLEKAKADLEVYEQYDKNNKSN